MKLDQAPKRSESQYLTFCVGEECLGLAAPSIKDVMYTPKLTPVPLASFEVAGLQNLRGHIVTAVYAASFLNIDTAKPKEKSMCIVLQNDDDELYSFIVNKVFDIESWPMDLFEPLPLNVISKWEDFADGVFRLEGRVVTILNKEKILKKLF